MHPIAAAKHLGHDLHDCMLTLWNHIDQHLHSRPFWTGVGAALLFMGVMALLLILANNSPLKATGEYPYGIPYTTPYMR